jgi:ATP-dependent helicase/nuclease subunit B
LIRLPKDVSEAIEQGRTVLVPSRQRSEAVRLAYAAQCLARGRTVWATPDVLPLDTWIVREIERRSASGERVPRLLTPAEDWLLWRQCTSQQTDDVELVARGPLADALRRASQLAQEFCIDISRAVHEPTDSEGRLLYEVEQAVSARAQSMGAANATELAGRLSCLGSQRDVVLAGFERLTPRLDLLMTSRGAGGCFTDFWRPAENAFPIAHARAVIAADTNEELERIAEWCTSRLKATPDARLLVLVPGAPEARERLVTLIRQSVDPAAAASGDLNNDALSAVAAIEGGVPLARNPLAAHALRALSWLSGGSEFGEFSAWLCAPHWTMPDAARARLDLWLRDRAPLEMDSRRLLAALEGVPDALKSAASELGARVLKALRQLGTGQASPRQWSERFTKALEALGALNGRTLTSAEAQTHERIIELLDDFGGLSASVMQISRDTAVQWLTELAGRTSFRPASGDPLVTISSQLTDPIVHYDGVWVCGLHSDAWPAPVQPDPFLPLRAQIAAGVPAASAAGRAGEARALMNAWANATPELVISSPMRADDVQLSRSPLVMRFVGATEETSDGKTTWLPEKLRRDGLTEFVDDTVGTSWDVSRPLPSGTRSVELQNLCPFRSYAELRLGSRPLEAPEPGVAPDVRGQLLHKSLEKVWRALRSSDALCAQSDESLGTLIRRCVDEAALEIMGPPPGGMRVPAEERECRRAVRLIHALCDLERNRTPFNVRDMERDTVLQLAGAQLRLRIDRLDELGSGGLAILDYKSGRPIPGDWYSERPSHPQLLAYLAAVGRDTVAMATVSVTAREIRFDGVAAGSDLLPRVKAVEPPSLQTPGDPWAIRQDEWFARVEQLVSDFVAGRAIVDPRPKACEYCHVVSVCRISDAAPDAVESNVGE